jgi:hypothetical protein
VLLRVFIGENDNVAISRLDDAIVLKARTAPRWRNRTARIDRLP